MTTGMTYQEHADQSHGGTYLTCKVCWAGVTFDAVRDEPVAVVTAVAPEIVERRERIATAIADIDRAIADIDRAIEADHIATEAAHARQLRMQRRTLYAELDALPRARHEPATRVQSLGD